MTIFYALSFLSGFFETGPLMMTLVSGFALGVAPETAQIVIARALACALCYQIGNLAPRPLDLPKPMIVALGFVGAFCFTLTILPLPSIVVLAASLLGTVFISACIQSARAVMKSSVPKMVKRALRVAGFATGFFCIPALAPVAAVLAVFFASIAMSRVSSVKGRIILPRLNELNVVMIFHQIHYFVYCYAAFIVAFELGGRTAAVITFLANWIVYVASPLLYRKVKDFRVAFFFGHSLLVLLLTGLYFAPSMPVKVILYLLTGIGGTTEFCIGGLAKKWGLFNEDAQGFSENLGHVLGVTFCLVLFITWGDLSPSSIFAAVFALAAIVCTAKKTAAINKENI
jgi:hypothetical protein